jgi:hypothetical protein
MRRGNGGRRSSQTKKVAKAKAPPKPFADAPKKPGGAYAFFVKVRRGAREEIGQVSPPLYNSGSC